MPIIVAIIGSQGLIVAALALMAFRVGRQPSREEFNALHNEVADNKVELKQDIADLKLELKQDIADLKLELVETKQELRQELVETKQELRQEIAEAKQELQREIAEAKNEVLQEIRRSHQQIMLALVSHTHREGGEAVFTMPPDLELVPAPADN
jgi:Skp family chaperone for outer membrane proteins